MDGMTINHIVSIDHGSYDNQWNLPGTRYHFPTRWGGPPVHVKGYELIAIDGNQADWREQGYKALEILGKKWWNARISS